MQRFKAAVLAGIVPAVLAADIATKQWALRTLDDGVRRHLIGEAVPLTLAFNTGAAFSVGFGAASRWLFLVFTLLALGVLARLFHRAPSTERLRLTSIVLLGAGAVGNLIDRVRWDRGVVDFIGPIDLGFMLWPIFNVADMAITCGAVLLALSLGGEKDRLPETTH